MGIINNIFKAAVDIVAMPVKVVGSTLDGDSVFEVIEESLEDIKKDFNE